MKTTKSLRNMLFTGLAITGLVFSSIGFTSCEEDDDGENEIKKTEEQGFQLLSAYVEGEQGSLPSDYQTQLENHFNDNGNVHDTTGMVSLSYDDILNTIIPASGEAGNGEALSGDNFIEEVSYQGAFEPGGSNWASWTLTYGMEDYANSSYTYEAQDTMTVSGNITSSTTWSNTTLYKLDGFVFVTNGAKLTIEAGTMIQGLPGQGENASALIIANDGEIMAQGTADKPIVFTGDDDTYTGDNYGTKVSGLWGGLIVLGNAPTNNPGNYRVEGIPESDDYPSTYGGDVSDDNSGILEYVSIRHGGTNIGQGNEINGLTLAGVGTGTTIDNIEVIANVDDGVEWFGGTANTSHLFVAYCGDDSFDYDEGFQGKGQFWATVQAEGTGNRLGEHDSGGDGEGTKPYSKPQIYNATYVGNGSETLITFRDDAGGTYANSIFYNVSEGIEIEYRDDKHCSWDQFATEGNLVIKNNIFKGIAE
jgi:hypothetical protein